MYAPYLLRRTCCGQVEHVVRLPTVSATRTHSNNTLPPYQEHIEYNSPITFPLHIHTVSWILTAALLWLPYCSSDDTLRVCGDTLPYMLAPCMWGYTPQKGTVSFHHSHDFDGKGYRIHVDSCNQCGTICNGYAECLSYQVEPSFSSQWALSCTLNVKPLPDGDDSDISFDYVFCTKCTAYPDNGQMIPLHIGEKDELHTECEGSCNAYYADTGCEESLECWDRTSAPTSPGPPGCSGTPLAGNSYCFDPKKCYDASTSASVIEFDLRSFSVYWIGGLAVLSMMLMLLFVFCRFVAYPRRKAKYVAVKTDCDLKDFTDNEAKPINGAVA